MIMDKEEILRAYRNAKDRDKQITILAQLNAVDRGVMEAYIKDQLASTVTVQLNNSAQSGQTKGETPTTPEKDKVSLVVKELKQAPIAKTRCSATTFGSLPSEVKSRVYRLITAGCSYSEYCEATGFAENKQTKQQYANLRSRARADGYTLKDQRSTNGASKITKLNSSEEPEPLFSNSQIIIMQDTLDKLKGQLSDKVSAIAILQREKSELETRVEKLQKILDIIKE